MGAGERIRGVICGTPSETMSELDKGQREREILTGRTHGGNHGDTVCGPKGAAGEE
jgi:hypothetical protein